QCPVRSQSPEAGASNSNCTQQLLCLINFLARNTGVSTHPKNDLLCLCPGFLKTPLPIKGLDVPLLYRTNGIVVYRCPCSWPGLRNFSIADLHPVAQSSSFFLFLALIISFTVSHTLSFLLLLFLYISLHYL